MNKSTLDFPKISVSGMRGKYPEQINEHLVYKMTKKLFAQEGVKTVALARDTRPTGGVIEKAIIAAARESFVQIHYVGLLPLPTLHLYTKDTAKIDMGIHITASHNPEDHNGLKVLTSTGEFYNPVILQKVFGEIKSRLELFEENKYFSKNDFEIKNVFQKAQQAHIDLVASQAIQGKRLIVAVDALNSVGSNVVPLFLDKTNCKVLPVAIDLSKPFPHKPEPKPKNLVWTQNQLIGKTYDLGVVLDPDADRLVLIDEKTNLLSEETTIALIIKSLVVNKKQGVVVLNYSTSMMAEYIAKDSKITIKRVAVGEKNVVEGMKKHNAIFGGEGSGGIIDPRTMYTRDALTGVMHIVNLMRTSNQAISSLTKGLPKLYIIKDKVSVEGVNFEEVKNTLTRAFREKKPNILTIDDGVYAKWNTQWIHVRPSNTEPILRIFSEAKSKEQAIKNASWVKDLIQA